MLSHRFALPSARPSTSTTSPLVTDGFYDSGTAMSNRRKHPFANDERFGLGLMLREQHPLVTQVADRQIVCSIQHSAYRSDSKIPTRCILLTTYFCDHAPSDRLRELHPRNDERSTSLPGQLVLEPARYVANLG